MKKIYYVSTRDVADGIVNEATVIKETEKTYIAKIGGYERTLRKGDMKCGTIETFYAFEEYTDALMWLKDRAESEKLTALAGKSVFIKFAAGAVAAGFLHIDTAATFANCPNYDNKRIIGYYLETPTHRIHFKKSHVKRIEER